VDIYEIVSEDATVWDVLTLNMYHPRKSRRAPRGYRLASQAERKYGVFLGANTFVQDFPRQLPDAIKDTYDRFLGHQWANRDVRLALERTTFARPRNHAALVAEILKLQARH
jgi:hypothetical protein